MITIIYCLVALIIFNLSTKKIFDNENIIFKMLLLIIGPIIISFLILLFVIFWTISTIIKIF